MSAPPYDLMGWLGLDAERRARDSLMATGMLVEYSDVRQRFYAAPSDPSLAKPVWELEKQVLGQLLPTHRQQSGDCVSFAVKQAGERRQVIEIAAGQEERWREWFAPWIYAVSRNQVGGGMSGAGSTGAWGAAAVNRYGVLFADDEGVPAYSGGLADRWGRAANVRNPEYQKFFEIASDNLCQTIHISTVEQAIEMIRDHRRPITIASSRGFQMTPRIYRDHHVFTPSGTWYHQMCFVEYNADLPALYRLNSWGPTIHGSPRNGETPGGAWNLLDDIAAEIRTRGVEMYVLVEFDGEPAEPDHNIL